MSQLKQMREPTKRSKSYLGRVACFVFVFICFFPNPAWPVGASTGLQASHFLTLVSVPFLLLSLPKRQTLTLLILALPMLMSGSLVLSTGNAISSEVVVNSILTTFLALLILIPSGRITKERYVAPMLLGVASALLIHAVIGAYQMYQFTNGTFPLLALYQNPLFGTMTTNGAAEWAIYVKRPFGLFPEPSAMAASIGPWLVLMVGLLLYPGLRTTLTHRAQAIVFVAVSSGMLLLIVSRSGYVAPLLASLLLLFLPVLGRLVSRLYRPRNFIALLLVTLVSVVVLSLAMVYLSPRLVQQDASWSARAISIIWGITSPTENLTSMIIGVGPGQSFLILQSSAAAGTLPVGPADLPVTAVWSMAVLYIQEMGLIGAVALAVVLIMILQAIARSSARLVGYSCLLAWLAGVVLTTSYLSLSPIWLFLSMLLSWDHVFQPRVVSVDTDLRVRAVPATDIMKA